MANIFEVVEAMAALPGVLEIDNPSESDGYTTFDVMVEQSDSGWYAVGVIDEMIHIGCDCPDERHPDYVANEYPPSVTLTVMWIEDATATFAVSLDPGIDLDECLRNLIEAQTRGCSQCREEEFAEIEAFLASQGSQD